MSIILNEPNNSLPSSVWNSENGDSFGHRTLHGDSAYRVWLIRSIVSLFSHVSLSFFFSSFYLFYLWNRRWLFFWHLGPFLCEFLQARWWPSWSNTLPIEERIYARAVDEMGWALSQVMNHVYNNNSFCAHTRKSTHKCRGRRLEFSRERKREPCRFL